MRLILLAACAALIGGCAATGLPLVHRDDQQAYDARLADWRAHSSTGFAAYDRDGNGRVGPDEWVEANLRLARLADLDDDGALDRYEALFLRDVPQRRKIEGQAALAEFDRFWRDNAKAGKLRESELAALFRADFAADDVDRNGVLTCAELFAPGPACTAG
ncbi:hypothetical protein [Caulobacter sp. 17J65-9]|uniref:hypothetical protein n=1 Tax=Caulobacter sp. 17J65-9 TaxID=2709382 RepID=UPI0013C56A18|nr:hypothetical protein [Caulobacter sp. 17J65-9]NEX91981.1 hypothetical protein [Caulobacter sp. 17J65-9]